MNFIAGSNRFCRFRSNASNLPFNAEFIHKRLSQGERLKWLNQIAIRQMQVLTSSNLKTLPGAKGK